ncbi:cytochrome-c oxidase, cbb3-type subunit II [Steroidobacter agaridevorans]|nr:cytochrome-c oxidase, cbb3-type subunit II [Steroidobacter agaridevorans]
MKHEFLEKKIAWMGALIAVVISIGGLVEIAPLYMQSSVVEPSPGIKPYAALALEGRDVYVREGCYNCHSQMVRPLPAETERYGHYSIAGEAVYDHPFQFGSKRTGPDLARVGGRYTDEWHRIHLMNPRDVVPESNMPGFPWLAERTIDPAATQAKMQALQKIGVPYTSQEIADAPEAVRNRSEMEALIAYMQGLKFYGEPKAADGSAQQIAKSQR